LKTEMLYGYHPVNEALKACRRKIHEIHFAKTRLSGPIEALLARAETARIPVKQMLPAQLKAATETDMHQGIGALVSPFPFAPFAQVLDPPVKKTTGRFLLLLDSIVDPRNLGALIRTALCAGIDGVLIPKDRSALPSPLVSKASSGALEHVTLAKVTNMADSIDTLKQNGVWVVGLDKHASRSLYDGDFCGDLAVVIGGEEKGIRPRVRKKCDYLVSIPQSERVNSLNASVAGAVMMYEAYRQRWASGI